MAEKIPDKKMMQKQMSADNGWKTKTGTITSVQDPGLGHESHQLAIILPPSSNVYKGILTYDASENIQLVTLHGPLHQVKTLVKRYGLQMVKLSLH